MKVVILLSVVSCHLVLNIPEVWGILDAGSLETPLDATTDNWVCAGQSPGNSGIVELVAGNTYSYDVICGELDPSEPGCLDGDWHTGNNQDDYSGCALSVNYDDYSDPDSYKYISVAKDCPRAGSKTDFYISKQIQDCDDCVCSWTWAPSRKYSSPAQFYQNCFLCTITGGTGSKESMKKLDIINVQGANYNDIVYNDIVTAADIEDISSGGVPEEEDPEEVPEPEEEKEDPVTPTTGEVCDPVTVTITETMHHHPKKTCKPKKHNHD